MNYQYLEGNDVYIYPSANSDDGGDVNSEGNLKTLIDSLVSNNFIVKKDESAVPFEVTRHAGTISSGGSIYTVEGANLSISAGEAIIDGHYVRIVGLSEMSTAAFVASTGYTVTAESYQPHLVLALLKDTTGNARGDLLEQSAGSFVRIAKGVGFTLTDSPEDISDSIDLGVMTLNTTTYPAGSQLLSFEVNIDSYKYINVSSLKLSPTGSILNPIYINNNTEFEEITRVFECTTAGDISNKALPLPNYTTVGIGDIVKIRFTNSNTTQNLQLGGTDIYLSDGRACPWYAISEINTVYEFLFIEVSSNDRWILLNPSSPMISASYTYFNPSQNSLYLKWREVNGVVSVYAQFSQAGGQGGSSSADWRSVSRSQLPVPLYYDLVPNTTYRQGNFVLPLSTSHTVLVSWGGYQVSTEMVQASFITLSSALSSPASDFTFSYPL